MLKWFKNIVSLTVYTKYICYLWHPHQRISHNSNDQSIEAVTFGKDQSIIFCIFFKYCMTKAVEFFTDGT